MLKTPPFPIWERESGLAAPIALGFFPSHSESFPMKGASLPHGRVRELRSSAAGWRTAEAPDPAPSRVGVEHELPAKEQRGDVLLRHRA